MQVNPELLDCLKNCCSNIYLRNTQIQVVKLAIVNNKTGSYKIKYGHSDNLQIRMRCKEFEYKRNS